MVNIYVYIFQTNTEDVIQAVNIISTYNENRNILYVCSSIAPISEVTIVLEFVPIINLAIIILYNVYVSINHSFVK